LSDLLVRLKLDEKGLNAQMKGVSSKFKDVVGVIGKITLPVAAIAGIARAVDGLAAMGEAAINTIAPLHDAAAQLGVTAERLQELRAIAGNAGVGVEQFDKALGILNRTLGQVALGQGEFDKIAKAAGISLRDEQGHIKTTTEVWDALTAKIQSGAISQNTAIGLAAAAFGREGGKMVQVLRQTAEEQQRVVDTAREFGAIISNEVVAAADEYEDKLSLIKQGTEALSAQNELILAPLTLAWAGLKNEIAFTVAELARAAGLIDNNTTLMRHDAEALKNQINLHRQYLEQIKHPQPLDDPLLQQLTSEWAALMDKIEAAEAAAKKVQPPSAFGTDAGLMAPDQGLSKFDEDLADQRIEVMRDMTQTIEGIQKEARQRELEAEQELLLDLANARAEAADMELEQYFQKEGLLTEARRQGMRDRLAFDNMEAGEKVATAIGAVEQITAGIAQHSKKAFNLNKLAAIANAIINTAEGATKALAQGGFFGIGMAAAVIAAGAAQIGAIKRTTFQGGGGGTTPSAAGSVPTVNGNPVSSDRIITLRGVDPEKRYTGRQLIDLINEATRDGAKLVLAH
jgi:hypothetical protein